MVVDIHCHILYGIDDGPKTLEESISLCRMLQIRGIDKVIATPHFIGDYDSKPTPESINEKISALKREMDKESIKLEIYPGMEVFASNDTVDRIQNGEILTLNNSRYVLIEFSFENIPKYMSELLFSMQLKGYVPIIAHPERYNIRYRKSGIIKQAVENGSLLQVNSGSIMGAHGSEVREEVIRLLRSGMVHLIATDAHGGRRPVYGLSEVEKELVEICGVENAKKLLYINPQRVFEDGDVEETSTVKERFSLLNLFRKIKHYD
ncbi:tyrosine-protein phosphatase [Acetivibrio mesophilus]|uniref:protein-tyrosine-phosphatase n=1 Tax=Acetivibrio mesophilus TaxID=2487273 RepID=A0A4Q0I368_9FIRM|nr:CpsB/CapC family capsule biosynthesis tyrosine phosphatase [Acetivibrio mesophilus]RXE58668.1 phosphoesterase [Acetivibrio mesophilus]